MLKNSAVFNLLLLAVLISISPLSTAMRARFAVPFDIAALPPNYYEGLIFTGYEDPEGHFHPFSHTPLMHEGDTYRPMLELRDINQDHSYEINLRGTLRAVNANQLLPAVNLDVRLQLGIELVNDGGSLVGEVTEIGQPRFDDPSTRARRTGSNCHLTNPRFNPTTGASTDGSRFSLSFRPERMDMQVLVSSLLQN